MTNLKEMGLAMESDKLGEIANDVDILTPAVELCLQKFEPEFRSQLVKTWNHLCFLLIDVKRVERPR